eukprot:scaffold8047_cov417-Prasinococcus_capsulatus_cf.AAC.8
MKHCGAHAACIPTPTDGRAFACDSVHRGEGWGMPSSARPMPGRPEQDAVQGDDRMDGWTDGWPDGGPLPAHVPAPPRPHAPNHETVRRGRVTGRFWREARAGGRCDETRRDETSRDGIARETSAAAERSRARHQRGARTAVGRICTYDRRDPWRGAAERREG